MQQGNFHEIFSRYCVCGNIKVSKILFSRDKNVTLFSIGILNENRTTLEFNLELIETTKIFIIFVLRFDLFAVFFSRNIRCLIIFFTLTRGNKFLIREEFSVLREKTDYVFKYLHSNFRYWFSCLD